MDDGFDSVYCSCINGLSLIADRERMPTFGLFGSKLRRLWVFVAETWWKMRITVIMKIVPIFLNIIILKRFLQILFLRIFETSDRFLVKF